MENVLVRNILALIFSIILVAFISTYRNVQEATEGATVVDAAKINVRDRTIAGTVALPLTAQDILEIGEADAYTISIEVFLGDEDVYFYVPQMNATMKLLVGEGVEFSNIQSVLMSDPFRQRAISFQKSKMTHTGSNILQLTIKRSDILSIPNQLILSKVFVSQSSGLLEAIKSRLLIEDLMRPFVLGIQIILTVYMGVIAVLLSMPVLRWFTLFFATATLLTSGYLVSLIGIPNEMFRFSFLVVSGLTGLSLIGAAQALRGLHCGKGFFALIVIICASNAGLAISDAIPPFTQYITLNGPISIFGFIYFVSVLLWQPLSSYKVEKILLIASLCILLSGWVHDVLVQGGVIGEGILIGNFTRMGVAFSALGYVIIIQIQNHKAVQNMVQSQEMQIREKDSIIKNHLARELEDARLLAVHEERQNLNRELHDGVSSNLVSVISMLKKQDASQDIISLAQLTIRELRSVITATSVTDSDLGFFLSLFREEYLRYYDLEEEQVLFSLDRGALEQKIDAFRGMQILRILQETFANIVKHAHEASVSFKLESLPDNNVTITVSNTIDPLARAEKFAGLGLINMQTRAKRAGCSLHVSQSDRSFSIKIKIPH